MKLTLLLVFLVMATFGNSFSQVTLSLHFDKANILDVLGSIEKKTDFVFLYKDEILDGSKEISVDFQDAKFEEVLKSICDQSNVDFEIRERQIILTEKPNVPELSDQQKLPKKTISGKVTDGKGQTLPGVTVIVKGTTIGIITDADGSFKFICAYRCQNTRVFVCRDEIARNYSGQQNIHQCGNGGRNSRD